MLSSFSNIILDPRHNSLEGLFFRAHIQFIRRHYVYELSCWKQEKLLAFHYLE